MYSPDNQLCKHNTDCGATNSTISAPPATAAQRSHIKKLPWLDGKSSLATSPAASTSPPARSDSQSLSPVSPHPIESPNGSTAILEENDLYTTPAKPHTLRHRGSVSFNFSEGPVPTTARHVPSHVPSAASHGPAKRLSIVSMHDERPRADSLAPIPDHLERTETPVSITKPLSAHAHTSSPPHIVKTVQISPTQPTPKPGPLKCVNPHQLSNTVEGLEGIVQEAVLTAEDTNDPEQVAQLYAIVENAKNAIQGALVDPSENLMMKTSPLAASEYYDGSDCSSDSSVEEVAHIVKPTHPIPVPKHQIKGSESFDWAYNHDGNPKQYTNHSPVLSTNLYNVDRRHSPSRYSTQSPLLLPRQTPQLSPSRIDHVIQPAHTVQDSRGRSQRRDSEPGTRQRRSRKGSHSHHERSISLRRMSRQNHNGFTSYDKSFEEDDLHAAGRPHGIRRNGSSPLERGGGNEHIFNLRRFRRRQPIARNWRTSKKRLTATIACINTALLGIIVGIYVSNGVFKRAECL